MKKILLITMFLFSFMPYGNCVEDKVVAVVNNEAITKAELDSYISLIKLQIGYDGWRDYEMTPEKALENLIEDKLVLQEAKRKNIEVAPRLIDARVEEIKRKLGSEEQFSEFLAREGLSLSELKKRFEQKLLSEKLVNMEVRGRIFVSPKEVTDYYQEHKDDFYLKEKADLESIFVKDQQVAQRIYDRLQEGADFFELEKKYSEKGSIGLVAKGEMKEDIGQIIFALNPGEFSAPLNISNGYYIVLVKEKINASRKELLEVQTYIYNLLWDQKFNARLRNLLADLRSKSYIIIKDE